METIPDFEEMLELLEKHDVHYLIIGCIAFIFHARPRYTKEMDIWLELSEANVKHANAALLEFGSPYRLDGINPAEVLQIGMPPDRIDFIFSTGEAQFQEAWAKRIRAPYGPITANWLDFDTLLAIKSAIPDSRHQEDARVLHEIKLIQAKRRP